MTAEQRLFLALLRDHVNQTMEAAVPKRTDWKKLYAYAEEQSLLGVCYIQLKELVSAGAEIPEDVMQQFHNGFFNDVYMHANQRSSFSDVSAAFLNAGITTIPFKGWVIKEYWPVPALRTMGDIDILIHSEDRETTDSAMASLGYQRLIDNHAVWTYHQKEIIFELHDHMFYEHLTNEVDYRSYFDRSWDYMCEELDESYHFLYMITHMAKHVINSGMGFRAYLDIVFFCRRAKNLRWDWICDELQRLKLLPFAKTCFAFCRDWFGFEPPLSAEELDPVFFATVTDKVFRDGIFGLENGQNEVAQSAKEISYSEMPYWIGAVLLTLRRLFPSYRDMQLIPWYSFVDGRPWLLPIAWIYRWGYCLVHKFRDGMNLLLEPMIKKKTIEKRQKLIQDWGL